MKKSLSLLSLFGLLLAGGLLLLGSLSPRLEAGARYGTSLYVKIGQVWEYVDCAYDATDCCVVTPEPRKQA